MKLDRDLRKSVVGLFRPYLESKGASYAEKGVYDFARQYCRDNRYGEEMFLGVYNDRYRHLIKNMASQNRTIITLIKDVSSDATLAYDLAFKTPAELNQKRWIKILMRFMATQERLNNVPAVEWEPCTRCKKNAYTYKTMQLRRCDEPETIIYTCRHCAKVYNI